jgi:hypothetical protein
MFDQVGHKVLPGLDKVEHLKARELIRKPVLETYRSLSNASSSPKTHTNGHHHFSHRSTYYKCEDGKIIVSLMAPM